ncbi:MAG: hypothetical protein Q9166_003661 [cf. Caloplaca sp. 2 TL-2023]
MLWKHSVVKVRDGNGSEEEDHGWEDDENEQDRSEEHENNGHLLGNGNDEGSPGNEGKITMESWDTVEELVSFLLSEEERDDMALIDFWKPPRDFRANVQTDFMVFCDREKSRPFKAGWHAADLHPGRPERWQEAQDLVKSMKNFIAHSDSKFKHCRTLRFLDVHPDQHRRVIRDARDAHTMTAFFSPCSFLSSERGIPPKDSLLDQRARALNPTLRRPFVSNAKMPRDFWEFTTTGEPTPLTTAPPNGTSPSAPSSLASTKPASSPQHNTPKITSPAKRWPSLQALKENETSTPTSA